jgi:hypothetical protein
MKEEDIIPGLQEGKRIFALPKAQFFDDQKVPPDCFHFL